MWDLSDIDKDGHLDKDEFAVVSFGGGRILVWGCFSGAELGPLVPVKRTLYLSKMRF